MRVTSWKVEPTGAHESRSNSYGVALSLTLSFSFIVRRIGHLSTLTGFSQLCLTLSIITRIKPLLGVRY